MTDLTDYGERAVLDGLLEGKYLGLFTAAPGEGTAGTEVSGNGYERQPISFGAAATSTGTTTAANDAAVDFTANGGNWGSITHFGLFDAETSGNLHLYDAWSVSKTINDGDSLIVPIGAVVVEAR